jgi:hypothetical protein
VIVLTTFVLELIICGIYWTANNDELLQALRGSGLTVAKDSYVITNINVINGCQGVVIHNKSVALLVTIVTYDT